MAEQLLSKTLGGQSLAQAQATRLATTPATSSLGFLKGPSQGGVSFTPSAPTPSSGTGLSSVKSTFAPSATSVGTSGVSTPGSMQAPVTTATTTPSTQTYQSPKYVTPSSAGITPQIQTVSAPYLTSKGTPDLSYQISGTNDPALWAVDEKTRRKWMTDYYNRTYGVQYQAAPATTEEELKIVKQRQAEDKAFLDQQINAAKAKAEQQTAAAKAAINAQLGGIAPGGMQSVGNVMAAQQGVSTLQRDLQSMYAAQNEQVRQLNIAQQNQDWATMDQLTTQIEQRHANILNLENQQAQIANQTRQTSTQLLSTLGTLAQAGLPLNNDMVLSLSQQYNIPADALLQYNAISQQAIQDKNLDAQQKQMAIGQAAQNLQDQIAGKTTQEAKLYDYYSKQIKSINMDPSLSPQQRQEMINNVSSALGINTADNPMFKADLAYKQAAAKAQLAIANINSGNIPYGSPEWYDAQIKKLEAEKTRQDIITTYGVDPEDTRNLGTVYQPGDSKMRTDRNNNPIASKMYPATVKILENAGLVKGVDFSTTGDSTAGVDTDAVGTVTFKDPQTGVLGAIAVLKAGQMSSWYANPKYGGADFVKSSITAISGQPVKTAQEAQNVFNSLSVQQQAQIVGQIYKHEGGKGQFTTSPTQGAVTQGETGLNNYTDKQILDAYATVGKTFTSQKDMRDAINAARKTGFLPSASAKNLTPNQKADLEMRIGTNFENYVKESRTAVRNIGVINTSYQKALDDMRNGQSINAASQGVLISFQKVLDPGSVVRESEYARSGEGQSLLNRIDGLKAQISQGGAGLTAQNLKEFVDASNLFLDNYKQSMMNFAQKAAHQADSYGLDLQNILTPDVIKELDKYKTAGVKPASQSSLAQLGQNVLSSIFGKYNVQGGGETADSILNQYLK